MRLMRQAASHPAELRGVERRHVDHGDAHAAPVVQELGLERLREGLHRVLGRAIRGLERNGAEGQRRAHLHDRAAIPRQHVMERREGPVDVAEVGDLGHPAVFLGTHLFHRREDAHHRVVDPGVDGTDLALHPVGRGLYRSRIRDVGRDRECPSSIIADLPFGRREAISTPGDQRHDRSARAERAGDGAPPVRRQHERPHIAVRATPSHSNHEWTAGAE